MSKKQEDFRKRLLAKIHMHERYKEIQQAGFWEEWVELRYGLKSAKFLSINELKEVLDLFNNRVADRDYMTSDRVGRAMLLPLAQKVQTLSKKQALSIEHLLNILRYNDKQKKAFFKRQINKEIDSIAALSKEEATKIIIGLEKIIQWDSKRLQYANNADFNA
ncbi:hypothetical protein NHP164001_17720 [Helicobacter trogontum]|uniref:DUF1018 domain-containing protein n=1 Tax=Helicobacter trogontum TaxID=50960 RepID=A0ABQ0D5X3_9HELI